MLTETTIASIITPLYESGVGIIRISGPQALAIGEKIFLPANEKRFAQKTTFQVFLGDLIRQDGSKLDQVLLLLMRAPHSYTGEDVLEIQTHGNPYILQEALKIILNLGALQSTPGEFTKRAFLNGRLDLNQSEAILDLITTKSSKGLEVALNQLEGKLSLKIKELNNLILPLIAFIEASIDFPEDEIDSPLNDAAILLAINNLELSINELLNTYSCGKILKEGLTTVLLGEPNVGKSTLLNQLLGEDRAIITPIAGTTRDSIEASVNLGGLVLNLVDTAGLRETADEIEKLGIEKTYSYLERSGLALLLLDGTRPVTPKSLELINELKALKKPYFILINKIDLGSPKLILEDSQIVYISAKTEEGLDTLISKIKETFLQENKEGIYINNLRYYQALTGAKNSLDSFKAGLGSVPYDLLSIDLRDAYDHLGEITGEKISEEVMTKIFQEFCIGK